MVAYPSPLPGDVVEQVFGYLDVVDLVRSTRVCVLWRDVGECRVSVVGRGWATEVLGDWEACFVGLGNYKAAVCGVQKVSLLGAGATELVRKISGAPPSDVLGVVGVNSMVPLPPIGCVQFWDRTPGVDPSHHFAASHLHLLCYDTSAPFSVLTQTLRHFKYYLEAPCILVGTKCDLPPDPLTTDLANILSHILSIPHVRTSARTGEGISRLKLMTVMHFTIIGGGVGGCDTRGFSEEEKKNKKKKKRKCLVQ